MPKKFNEFIAEMKSRPPSRRERTKRFLKTPRQIPGPPGGHPVPPGYKRVHDVISGGTKLVKVEEGIGGALIGGALGAIAGPVGAAVGAYAGHKIFQRAAQNKSAVDAIALRAMSRAVKKTIGPGIISRSLDQKAARKLGFDVISPDYEEKQKRTRKPQNTRSTPPAPHQVQQAAAPTQPVASVHPVHANHPAHGIFAQRSDETSAGEELARRRREGQAAAMARAEERVRRAAQHRSSDNYDARGTRGKKPQGPSSDVIDIPESAMTRYVHSGDYIPAGQSTSRELVRAPGTALARRPGTSVSVPPGSSSRYVGGERTRIPKAGKKVLSGILKKVVAPIGVVTAGLAAKGGYEADPTATTGEKLKNAATAALNDVSFGFLGKDADELKATADARKAAAAAPQGGGGTFRGVGATGTWDGATDKPKTQAAAPDVNTKPPAAAATPKFGEKGTGENVGKFWTGTSYKKPSEMSDEERYGKTGAAIRRLDPEAYKTRPGTAQGNIDLLKQLQAKGK